MARRPARLERAGALTPRDRIWGAIRAMNHATATGALFSATEIAFLTQAKANYVALHIDTVLSYVRGLAAAGYLQLVEADRPEGRSRRELAQYRLVRDVGVDAPRVTAEGKPVTQGIANEQIWRAMRILREFDCAELAYGASTEARIVSIGTVKTYVTFLSRAGYLALASPARPGGRGREGMLARYRFLTARNTGPRAPLVCRDKSVMDANTGAIVLPAPAKGALQ